MTLTRDEARSIAYRMVHDGLAPADVVQHFPATGDWKYPVEYIRQIARSVGYRWNSDAGKWQPFTGPGRRRRGAMIEGAMLVVDVLLDALHVPPMSRPKVRAFMEDAAIKAIDKRLDSESEEGAA